MIKQKSHSPAAAVYLFLFLSLPFSFVLSPGSEFLGDGTVVTCASRVGEKNFPKHELLVQDRGQQLTLESHI